jgi:hypothetical protein
MVSNGSERCRAMCPRASWRHGAEKSRLSVNATQAVQSPDLVAWLTLIGTWALVAVAMITVVVTSWQTRKGQKILYDQVQESIAQTDLQRKQIAQLVDEQERPRIRELIKTVLTPLIGNLEYNNQVRIRHYLEAEVLLSERLPEGGASSASRLTYDSFKETYPELAAKLKAYDEQTVDLRHMRQKFFQVLADGINRIMPSIVKEETLPAEWNVGKLGFPSVDVLQLIEGGIFATLRERTLSITGIQGVLWAKKDRFMALTEEPEAKQLIEAMTKLAQKLYEDGVALIAELSKLRESLGSRYKITREDYFVGNPFDR